MENDAKPVAAIIGTGFIGSSIGAALRQRAWRVLGHDRDALAARRAWSLGAIDVIASGLADIGPVDLAVIATTPDRVVAIARELLDRGVEVATDVTSSQKAGIVAAVNHPRFVGGHPMAGSERSGPDAARCNLFNNATWIVTPGAITDPDAVRVVAAMIESLGARPAYLTPAQHDDVVAAISHVPHVAATAVAMVAGTRTDALALAGGGLRDVTRIAKGDPALWTEILSGSPSLPSQLRDLAAVMLAFAQALDLNDRASVHRMLDEGRQAAVQVPSAAPTTASVATA